MKCTFCGKDTMWVIQVHTMVCGYEHLCYCEDCGNSDVKFYHEAPENDLMPQSTEPAMQPPF